MTPGELFLAVSLVLSGELMLPMVKNSHHFIISSSSGRCQPSWEVLLQVSLESLISVVRWQLWLEISRGSAGRPGQLGLSLCNFRAFSRGLSRRVGRFLPWKLRVPKSSKGRWKAQKRQSVHLLSVKRVTELYGMQKGVTPACEH